MSSITLTTFAVPPFATVPLSIGGTDGESPPAAAMSAVVDGVNVGALWDFAPASSTGGTWSGTLSKLEPGTYTLEVFNTAIPGNASNPIAFQTAATLPTTAIIMGDGPSLPVPPQINGSFNVLHTEPPVTAGTALPGFRAAVIGVSAQPYTGVGAAEQTWGCQLWASSDTGATFADWGEIDYITPTSGTYGVTINSQIFVGGTETYLDSVVAETSIVYFAQYVNGFQLINYGVTVSTNGTLIGSKTCDSANPGVFGPTWFNTINVFDSQTNISTPFVVQLASDLVLNRPGNVPGSTHITLTGTDTAPVLATGMDYNVDYSSAGGTFGLTFARVTSFNPASSQGGTWSAVIPAQSVGKHVVTVRDHDTPIRESNVVTLEVVKESITLTAVGGTLETLLDFGGVSNNGPPALVDISIDNLATWGSVTAYSNAGTGTVNELFLGTGQTITSAGTYYIGVRDDNDHTVVSNVLPLVVGPESILLEVATGTIGGALILGGLLYGLIPSALDVTRDHGGTWEECSAYGTSTNILPAPFLANSNTPTLTAGVFIIAVRDHVNTDVISNYLTLSLGVPDCVTPPSGPSLGRYRGNVGINWNGLTLFGDAWSGVIGSADFDQFLEYGNVMRALVTTPPLHSDRLRVFVKRFEIDVESGVGQTDCCGSEPLWSLDWSKDGGRTFVGLQIVRSMGRIGEYLTRLRWLRLGQSRQWIFRLQATDPVRRVIVGVYVDKQDGMG